MGITPTMTPGFGIYVHWPFCLSKCPYCDFNSRAAARVDQARWRAALLAELDWFAALAPRRTVTSIFFGGGTPSLMEPATVAALTDRVARLWPTAPGLEVTLEANPSTAEAGRFRDFRSAGVNRLSLGVQALDDESLRALGRRHDAAAALAALALAKEVFPRVSFDLIYARPGQGRTRWRDELGRALALAGEHLSLYQLTVEAGTAFARAGIALPGEDESADLFELTQAMTEAAGLPAYEVSNHARPGAECRHNLDIWRGGDYAGIGPGAHGRLGGEAFRQRRAARSWLQAVEDHGHATARRRRLDPAARAEELVMLGLRLTAGLEAGTFAAAAGMPLAAALDPAGLARMEAGGFVERSPAGLRATPRGRLVLTALTAELLG